MQSEMPSQLFTTSLYATVIWADFLSIKDLPSSIDFYLDWAKPCNGRLHHMS